MKSRSAEHSWITLTFLGAEILEKWHKTKGEHSAEPQMLSFLPWGILWAGGTLGLSSQHCQELLEQRGVPSTAVRDSSRGFRLGLLLGIPRNIPNNPRAIPEQFQNNSRAIPEQSQTIPEQSLNNSRTIPEQSHNPTTIPE